MTTLSNPPPEAPSDPIPSMDPLTSRILEVSEAAGEFIAYWGFKTIQGRVWTLLALKGHPMAQNELSQMLNVSRSLISGVIAELAEYGLVRAVGSHRNAPYEAVMDVWPVISDVLRKREWMLVDSARLCLEAAVEEAELGKARGEHIDWNMDRMRLLLSMTETAQTFIRIIIALRMPKSVPGISTWMEHASSLIRRFRSGP